MSTDVEESREDKNSKRVTPPGPALLTRAEAAALLRCSISSVRRLEGDVLHPIVGADGVHRFDPTELARVASHRSSRSVDGSKEGERDARVFEALEEGKGLREIVTTLRLPVDLVSKLHASWQKMGSNQDMILSSERLAQLRSTGGPRCVGWQRACKSSGSTAQHAHPVEQDRSISPVRPPPPPRRNR
jgi:hypothetical protein